MVDEIMIPLDNLFMIKHNDYVNEDNKRKVSESTYSKIPIFKIVKSDVVGYTKVKNLLNV